MQMKAAIELPPDGRSDEITLSVCECPLCKAMAVTVYQESRRGSLDDDSSEVAGYRLQAKDYSLLVDLIGRCPARERKHCECSTHRILGRERPDGIWDGLTLNGITPAGYFDVEFVPE